MAEEKYASPREMSHIGIMKCESGFMVVGSQFGGDNLRAFSTVDSLIEWLARELGAGPIVWALTLDIWAGKVGITTEDLLPVPDATTDPRRYQETLEDNARIIFTRFIQMLTKEEKPEEEPKPKPKKAKKPPEEKPEEEVKEE